MSREIINMEPLHRITEYCEGCQELGNEQVSGVKRHRSLPLDTWLVQLSSKAFEDQTREAVLCADCIDSAGKEEFIEVKETDVYAPVYFAKEV